MTDNLKLSHKALILVAVPLAFELVFVASLSILLAKTEYELGKEKRAHAIVSQAKSIAESYQAVVTNLTMYRVRRSHDIGRKCDDSIADVPKQMQVLMDLVQDNPHQVAVAKRVAAINDKAVRLFREAKDIMDEGGQTFGLVSETFKQELTALLKGVIAEVKPLVDEEKAIEESSPEEAKRSSLFMKILLGLGVVFNILLALALALFFHQSTMRRLGILMDNTVRLSLMAPLKPPLKGEDEISKLDQVFHDMANALTEARRKERAVIEYARDVICSIDAQGKFTAISPAALTVWGYAPEELLWHDYTEILVAEDLERTKESFQSIMVGASSVPFENRIRCKDGRVIDSLWSAHWSGAESSMFCVAHDITERKEAEEALRASEARIRTIINSMLAGVVITNADGVIESVNPRTEEMFGCEPGELRGKRLSDIVMVAGKTPSFAEICQKAMGKTCDLQALKKSGQPLAVEISFTEFQAKEGRRYLANLLDVTERHKIEELKKQFVAMVSHDLRTPLTSIRAFLTLLLQGAYGELSEQGLRRASMAEGSSDRLIALINDLLDIDKLESGKMEMYPGAVNTITVIDQSINAVQGFAEQSGVKLENAAKEIDFQADHDRLVQVLVNLISNAVKFSPKDSRVTVSAEESDGFVQFNIIDRGRGVPAHLREAIFDKFRQVEAADATKKGGSGLGLAICKAIVEAHGGRIGVESEEGRGSTFWFRLPREAQKIEA